MPKFNTTAMGNVAVFLLLLKRLFLDTKLQWPHSPSFLLCQQRRSWLMK